MAPRTPAHRGWVDLLLTLGDLGVAPPPIPQRHRRTLHKHGDLFWTTREDLDWGSMYQPDDFLREVMNGTLPKDYSAISYTGRGINSSSWNLQIVQGPIAVMVQDGWGGGLSFAPVKNDTEIAETYAWVRAAFRMANEHIQEGPARYLIYSGRYDSQGVHLYELDDESVALIRLQRGKSRNRMRDLEPPSMKWTKTDFDSTETFGTYWSSLFDGAVGLWP